LGGATNSHHSFFVDCGSSMMQFWEHKRRESLFMLLIICLSFSPIFYELLIKREDGCRRSASANWSR
jgi:hypothetical protein